MPFYRVLHILNDPFGFAGQSEQLIRALEDGGHGVTALRVSDNPWMFDGDALLEGMLLPYFEHGAPDVVLVSDGIEISQVDLACAVAAKTPVLRINAHGAVAEVLHEIVSEAPSGMTELYSFSPSVSRRYLSTELANFIYIEPCVLCAQARTPERERSIATLREALASMGSSVRVVCIGPGWDVSLPEHKEAALAYASRSAVAALVFPGDDTAALAVPLSDGVPLICLGADVPSFAAARAVTTCTDTEEAARELVLENARRSCGTEWEPAVRDASFLTSELYDDQVERLFCRLREEGAVGDGCDRPAVYATLCGYYGTGNFGDEEILSHLAHHIERHCGLAVVRAIAADAEGARHYGGTAVRSGDALDVRTRIACRSCVRHRSSRP